MKQKGHGGAGTAALVVLTVVVVCASAGFVIYRIKTNAPTPPTAAPGTLLVVSGDTAGWITPCGCTSNQSGGLLRRGTYLSYVREASRVIYVDAGGAAGGTSEYQKAKFEAILQGERGMGISVHNLGKIELAMGAEYLREVSKRLRVQFVSANARDANGEKIADGWMYAQSGDVRLGIVGVVSQKYATSEIRIDDPKQAILEAAGMMKGQCDYLVVLAYAPEEELTQLAAGLPEIDAIVGGPTGQAMSPRMVGSAMVASATNKGKFLLELSVPKSRGSGKWEGRVVEMGPALGDQAMQVANVKEYLQTLEARDFSARQSGLVEAMPAGAPADYKIAGSGACMKCHGEEYARWNESKHAHAFQTLRDKGFHVDSQCQQCHTTGYGLAGGFVSLKRSGAGELASVGCETCHGPSSAHVKDPRQRTSFAAADQCTKCHDHENSPRFEYAVYWEKIKHGKRIR